MYAYWMYSSTTPFAMCSPANNTFIYFVYYSIYFVYFLFNIESLFERENTTTGVSLNAGSELSVQ